MMETAHVCKTSTHESLQSASPEETATERSATSQYYNSATKQIGQETNIRITSFSISCSCSFSIVKRAFLCMCHISLSTNRQTITLTRKKKKKKAPQPNGSSHRVCFSGPVTDSKHGYWYVFFTRNCSSGAPTRKCSGFKVLFSGYSAHKDCTVLLLPTSCLWATGMSHGSTKWVSCLPKMF